MSPTVNPEIPPVLRLRKLVNLIHNLRIPRFGGLGKLGDIFALQLSLPCGGGDSVGDTSSLTDEPGGIGNCCIEGNTFFATGGLVYLHWRAY
jgi:hypothetical protein